MEKFKLVVVDEYEFRNLEYNIDKVLAFFGGQELKTKKKYTP